MQYIVFRFTFSALLICAFITAPFINLKAKENGSLITLVGHASVSALPDRAEISVGVKSKGKTAKESLALNSAQMKAVLDTLKSNGVLPKNIATSNFSIQPDYERYRDGRPPKIRGYSVSNTVKVIVEEIDKTGVLLDKVVQSGSNQIFGIRFYVSNADVLKDSARKKAIQNALRKAKVYSDAANLKLGKIVSIVEGRYGSPQPRPMARTIRAEAMSVPIERGEQQLKVSVTVTWEIE